MALVAILRAGDCTKPFCTPGIFSPRRPVLPLPGRMGALPDGAGRFVPPRLYALRERSCGWARSPKRSFMPAISSDSRRSGISAKKRLGAL